MAQKLESLLKINLVLSSSTHGEKLLKKLASNRSVSVLFVIRENTVFVVASENLSIVTQL